MRKLIPGITILFVFSLSACKNADKQVPAIASDFCNCFSSIEKNMTSDSRNIIITASNSSAPEKSIEEGILGLSEEKQMQVAMELAALTEMADENSEIGKCMSSVEKKYENSFTSDKKKFMERVVAELQSKGSCHLTAAFMRIGLKTGDFD